jgi:hypothetical protein
MSRAFIDPILANIVETTADAGGVRYRPAAAPLVLAIVKQRKLRVDVLVWRARVFAIKTGAVPRPRVRAISGGVEYARVLTYSRGEA